MKKVYGFMLMLLLISQTILGPIATVSAMDGGKNEISGEITENPESPEKVIEVSLNDKRDVEENGDEEITEEEEIIEEEEPSTDEEIIEEEPTANEEPNESLHSQSVDQTKQIITEEYFKFTKINMYDAIPQEDGSPQGKLISEIRPKLGDSVAVIFNWELIDDTHPYDVGATYTFQLPEGLKVPSNITNGVLDGGVGNYTVNTNGVVTFTFNGDIKGQKLSGYFYVWIKYDEEYFGEGKNNTVDFVSLGGTKIDVNFANPNESSELTKTGEPKKNGSNNSMNPDEIEWTVRFNQSEQLITGANLTDTLGEGLTLKGNTVDVYELTVQPNGGIVVPDTPTKKEVTLNGQEFSVNFGNISKAYEVRYTTTVTAPAAGGDVEFTNKAVLTGDGTDGITSKVGSAKVKFSEPLTKSTDKAVIYDPITQTTTWKVQYNYNEQTIEEKNAWIEDTFDTTKYELVPDSVKVYNVTINSNGTGKRAGEVNSTSYDVKHKNESEEDGGFKLKFKNTINTAYEIEYQIRPKDRRVYDSETINNKVTIYDETYKKGSKDIGQVIFKKENAGADFTINKTINWKLIINSDNKVMTDIVITDSYVGNHMQLLQDTIKVDGKELKDSLFELDAEESDYNEGFVIKLKSGKSLSTEAVITYTTKFNPQAGKPAEGSYKNTAIIEWNEDGKAQEPVTDHASEPYKSYTKENGNKTGSYNPKDKTITWTIDVNYNNYEITNAILKDEWDSSSTDAVKQTFVEGSLEVYGLIQNKENNSVSQGPKVTTITEEANLTINQDKNGFVLNLGDIGTGAYQIIYKTSLDGEGSIVGSYSNKATLTVGEEGPQRFEKSADPIIPTHNGKFVYKAGKQKDGEADIAQWTVTVNPSQSFINAGAVLTDTLSENQILLRDSIKIYTTVLPIENTSDYAITKGELVKKDFYTLSGEGNEIIITFNEDLKTSYILEYESFINTQDGDVIKNEVSFQGQTQNAIGGGSNEGIKVVLAGAGGGASTGSGKIKIVKLGDEEEPLAGAIFELYNASGTTLLETLITDKNGEALTKRNYRFNDNNGGLPYKLKEISAPSGYVIDEEYKDPKDIKFESPDKEITIVNNKIRQGFELFKVGDDNPSKGLQGAIFELRKNGVLMYELTSGEDGKVIPKGELEAGDYELIEKKAPDHYLLDASPIKFTIIAGQTEVLPLQNKVNKRGKGKIILTKVDVADADKPLEGAVFELFTSADPDNSVAKETTDANGEIVFDNLPYDNYIVKEVQAPEYYVIDKSDIKILLDQEEIKLLPIKNKKIDRSFKVIKVDSSNSILKLKGAEFELRKKDPHGEYKEFIETKTTDDKGEIIWTDLKVGEYQLIETKAPTGYRLDATPVYFEIEQNQTETKVVTKENRRVISPPPMPEIPEPERPTNPEYPSEPGIPGGENPASPGNPGGEDPNQPGKPGGEDPSNPSNPGGEDPNNPSNPGGEDPTDPNQPGGENPTNPNEPGGENPDDPNQSGGAKPNKPNNPGGSGSDGITTDNPKLNGNGTVSGSTNGKGQGGNKGTAAGGKLPQTGEETLMYMTILGSVLLLIGGVLLVRRRKTNE
ncbi:collagen binding domain-containing protein [Sporosarcina cyprini]|uniref:collagen binding domain-containing protein n=1 Tax=Sporosarcina cyprini TaxID=2910523 RepID=UPI001EDFE9FA|nr:SpaA isopeptide-forming pilin-related protein [Sporosarcina cyprini]MCG3087953.1 LPXTG cell wall anchor domain-containing protein [Sporosarcina cyprini]